MNKKLDPIGVLSESIIRYIREALSNASFDKTQKGIITETLSNNRYKVKIGKAAYTVPAVIASGYSVGDEVYVIIPQNDPDQMFLLPIGLSALDPSTTVLSVNGKTGYVNLGIPDIPDLNTELNNRVSKESGKGLSSNDYTTAEKNKLAGIAANANNYVHPSAHPASMITGLSSVATSGAYADLSGKPVLKPVATSGKAQDVTYTPPFGVSATDVQTALTELNTKTDGKVDKVTGKSLSTNDYTTAEKNKLAGIAANANNYVHPSNHPASMIRMSDGKTLQSLFDQAILVTDWNDAIKPGVYFSTDIAANEPPSPLGDDWFGQVFVYQDRIKQILTHASSAPIGIERWVRNWWSSNQSWSAWSQSFKDATPSVGGLMSARDKEKLDGVASNANNYVHPSTHPGTMITTSDGSTVGEIFANAKSVTDWNAATRPGWFYSSSSAANKPPSPVSDDWFGEVFFYMGNVKQILTPKMVSADVRIERWVRTRNTSGTWSSWTQSFAEATTSKYGLMSSADKIKLDAAYTGADARQQFTNAFIGEKSGSVVNLPDIANNTLLRKAAVQGATTEILANPDAEKSPDNIASISGVEPTELTVCGKNFINFNKATTLNCGITAELKSNGIIVLNGSFTSTPTGGRTFLFILKENVKFRPGNYYLSGCPAGGGSYTYKLIISITDSNGNVRYAVDYGSGGAFTIKECDTLRISVSCGDEIGTVNNLTFYPQIEMGSVKSPFKPYTGTAHPLPALEPLMSLPNGVCDEYDAVTGVETRRIGKTVLKGTETFVVGTHSNGQAYASIVNDTNLLADSLPVCTHYLPSQWTNINNRVYVPSYMGFVITDSRFTSKEIVSEIFAAQYAAGTPITVYYELESPIITQHTPASIPAIYPTTTVYADDGDVSVTYNRDSNRVYSELTNSLSEKVDKVAGKGLSTNDFTTAEKQKLTGIAQNANNYSHPTSSGNKHIPSGGADKQILRWNSDGTAVWDSEIDAYTKADTHQQFANTFIGEKSSKIVGLNDIGEDTLLRKAAIQGETAEILANPDAEKSPDNISSISGVEPTKVTVCGKNLLDINDRNVWTPVNCNIANGQATSNITDYYYCQLICKNTEFLASVFPAGKTLTFSVKNTPDGRWISIVLFGQRTGGEKYQEITKVGRQTTITVANDFVDGITKCELRFNHSIAPFTDTTTIFSELQLEVGSAATAYEPYTGTAHPLPALEPLMSLPNGVCDEYDAVTGVETRRVGKKALDGTEIWYEDPITVNRETTRFRVNLLADDLLPGSLLTGSRTTHYKLVGYSDDTVGYSGSYDNRNLFIKENFDTVDQLKSYLAAQHAAGTPVTVYYELAEPIITQHTPASIPAIYPTTTVYADDGDVSVTYNRDSNRVYSELTNSLSEKVDKVAGKGLSTNDYSTAEKQKLAEIAQNANNYVHPATHPAAMVVFSDGDTFQQKLDQGELKGDSFKVGETYETATEKTFFFKLMP